MRSKGVVLTIWDALRRKKEQPPATNGKPPAPAQPPIKKELPGAGIKEGPATAPAVNGGKNEIPKDVPVANVLDALIKEHRQGDRIASAFEISKLETPFGSAQLKTENKGNLQILTIIIETEKVPIETLALLENSPFFPYLDGNVAADFYMVNIRVRKIYKTVVEDTEGKTERKSDAYFIPIIPLRDKKTQELRYSISYFNLTEEQKMEIDALLEQAEKKTGKRYKVPGE